jgi:hypothetical protein
MNFLFAPEPSGEAVLLDGRSSSILLADEHTQLGTSE